MIKDKYQYIDQQKNQDVIYDTIKKLWHEDKITYLISIYLIRCRDFLNIIINK